MTPDDIQKMPWADVIENLEAHGLTFNDDSGMDLADLREKLAAVVFMGDL